MTKFNKLYNSIIKEAWTDEDSERVKNDLGQHLIDNVLNKLTQTDFFSNFYDRQGNLELYQEPEQEGFKEASGMVLGTAGRLEKEYGIGAVLRFINQLRDRLPVKVWIRFLQTSFKNYPDHYFFTHIMPRIRKELGV